MKGRSCARSENFASISNQIEVSSVARAPMNEDSFVAMLTSRLQAMRSTFETASNVRCSTLLSQFRRANGLVFIVRTMSVGSNERSRLARVASMHRNEVERNA